MVSLEGLYLTWNIFHPNQGDISECIVNLSQLPMKGFTKHQSHLRRRSKPSQCMAEWANLAKIYSISLPTAAVCPPSRGEQNKVIQQN